MIVCITAITAITAKNAFGIEPPISQNELYTFACIAENFSMKNRRDGCVLNIPALNQPIEDAYKNWSNKNKNDLHQIHAACSERLKVIEKRDPVRFNQLKEHASNTRNIFLSKASEDNLPIVLERCQELIKELNDDLSIFPANFAEIIRTAGTSTKSRDETAEKPILNKEYSLKPGFEIRLVLEETTNDCDSFFLKTPQGEIHEQIFTEKKALMNHTDFKSIKLVEFAGSDGPGISFRTTDDGKKSLANITRKYLGKRVSLNLYNQVLHVITIRYETATGGFVINNSYSNPYNMKELVLQIGSVD